MQNVVLGAYAYDLTHSSHLRRRHHLRPARADPGPAHGGRPAGRQGRPQALLDPPLPRAARLLARGGAGGRLAPPFARSCSSSWCWGSVPGSAMFGPAYSAILPGLVGREDLPGAISLNSAQMNASRVIGPVIGGLLYSADRAGLGLRRQRRHVPLRRCRADDGDAARRSRRWPSTPAAGASSRPASRWPVDDPVVGRCLVTVFVFSLLALAFIGQMPVVAAHNLGHQPLQVGRLRDPLRLLRRGRPRRRHLDRHRVRPHLQADARAGLPRRLLALPVRVRACSAPRCRPTSTWP